MFLFSITLAFRNANIYLGLTWEFHGDCTNWYKLVEIITLYQVMQPATFIVIITPHMYRPRLSLKRKISSGTLEFHTNS